MSRISIFAFSLATLAAIATTQAGAVQRTFVASNGSDANTAANCSLALPCRGFAAAQTVTDNNGEIIVLDSAGYGVVTVTKSISISAPAGVYAGISVLAGNSGVTIATAGINVVLRGLTINGQGGSNGINMTAGNKLTVENCLISNLSLSGITVSTGALVRITDSIIRDNGPTGVLLQSGPKATITRTSVSGHTSFGVRALGAAASTTTADIAESTLDGNGSGVYAFSTNAGGIVKVSVRDSQALRGTNYGLFADSSAGASVTLSASSNIISNNFTGIAGFSAGTKVWASGNTVSDNGSAGLLNSGALFESAGNNAVRNNAPNTSGTITAIATN